MVRLLAPAGCEYWAVNVTVLPLPEAGEIEVAAGSWGGGAVTPSRATHPVLPPRLDDWIAPCKGRSRELVWPPANMFPEVSTAMALAWSAPVPPYNVENVRPFPRGFSLDTKAS